MPLEPKQCCGSLGHRHKKGCAQGDVAPVAETAPSVGQTAQPAATAAKSNDDISALVKEIAELRKSREEDQKTLKMLTDVADKGRVFSWEAKQNKTGQPQKVKLSTLGDGVVVGWRTVRDELVTDPRTGRTVGESQTYELLVLGKDGVTTMRTVEGYLNFSNVRYENRIEAAVLSKSTSFDGSMTLDLGLPDGRRITLGSQFVN